MKVSKKYTIGRVDCIDLPELGLSNIQCKVDTGADTSSIHCHRVQIKEKDGKEYLNFKLLDPKHPDYQKKDFQIYNFKERRVRSSNGQLQFRYVITIDVIIYGQTYKTEFTLTDRGKMKYPILLGRKLLNKNFVVDVSKVNLSLTMKEKNITK